MKSSTAALEREARILTRHFVHEEPTALVTELYVRALRQNAPALSRKDARLLRLMAVRPWTIGLIDAGLALSDPHAEVRRRIYILFAILEAVPEYADKFLPKRRSPLYIVFVLYACGRAVVKAAAGLILIKVAA